MHVVHVITSLERGGAELHLLSLAAGQRKLLDNKVTVISLSPGGELACRFMEAGVAVEYVELSNKFNPIRCLVKLSQKLRELSPDVVHSHLLPANIVAGACATLVGIPHVASKHNDERQLQSSLLWRWIHALASFFFDKRVICLSNSVADYMTSKGVRKDKISVVYYAFDPELYRLDKNFNLKMEIGLDSNVFLLGIIARITPQKGHTYLLHAFKRFLELYPNSRLVLIGERDNNSSSPADVDRLIKELSLDEAVIELGKRTDAYSILNCLDVMLLPSLWEGFGMVLLEAASLEVPVIASDVSAIPEVVGKNGGILIPPANIEALTQALITMKQELPEWRNKLSLHRQSVFKKFSLYKLVTGTQAIYDAAR
jgi:glycosyltransferase involved in cell wall biosynthesis